MQGQYTGTIDLSEEISAECPMVRSRFGVVGLSTFGF